MRSPGCCLGGKKRLRGRWFEQKRKLEGDSLEKPVGRWITWEKELERERWSELRVGKESCERVSLIFRGLIAWV